MIVPSSPPIGCRCIRRRRRTRARCGAARRLRMPTRLPEQRQVGRGPRSGSHGTKHGGHSPRGRAVRQASAKPRHRPSQHPPRERMRGKLPPRRAQRNGTRKTTRFWRAQRLPQLRQRVGNSKSRRRNLCHRTQKSNHQKPNLGHAIFCLVFDTEIDTTKFWSHATEFLDRATVSDNHDSETARVGTKNWSGNFRCFCFSLCNRDSDLGCRNIFSVRNTFSYGGEGIFFGVAGIFLGCRGYVFVAVVHFSVAAVVGAVAKVWAAGAAVVGSRVELLFSVAEVFFAADRRVKRVAKRAIRCRDSFSR